MAREYIQLDNPPPGLNLEEQGDRYIQEFDREHAAEIQTFDRLVTNPQFIEQHGGKWVMLRGTQVLDFYSTVEEARKKGYTKHGTAQVLIEQVPSLPIPPKT